MHSGNVWARVLEAFFRVGVRVRVNVMLESVLSTDGNGRVRVRFGDLGSPVLL